MIIITIGSFKGGTSKTTSSLNIGYSLSILGKKVLLIDLDPQGNLTSSLGIPNEYFLKEFDFFNEENDLEKSITKTGYNNLFIIPSYPFLENYREFNLSNVNYPKFFLRKRLDSIYKNFDFCIIDTPPSLGMINKISFLSSDYIVPCIGLDPFSIVGLQKMFSYISDFLSINEKILGILISFWEKRSYVGSILNNILEEKFPKLPFSVRIHRDVSISRSVIQEKPVINAFPKSRASLDYISLSKEIIGRIKAKKNNRISYDRL